MKKFFLAALAGVGLATSPASAAVVSGALTGGSAFTNGGSFQFLATPPAIVGNDNQQSNNLFAFNEKANAALLVNITPDFGSALLAGQKFNSHFVFFDPDPFAAWHWSSVTFDAPILAVLAVTAKMNASDASFGLPSVTYLTPAARGLETNTDRFSVSGNTLSLDWTASDPGDYIRVLTAPVPEPATWAMMLLGFGVVGGAMRRRQKVSVSFA